MTTFADRSPRLVVRLALAIYALTLALLLLSPAPVQRLLGIDLGAQLTIAEQVTNVLVFIPMGFALAWWLYSRLGAVVVGTFVSVAVEVAQFLWLPERDASWTDTFKNAIGVTVGALLYRPSGGGRTQ